MNKSQVTEKFLEWLGLLFKYCIERHRILTFLFFIIVVFIWLVSSRNNFIIPVGKTFMLTDISQENSNAYFSNLGDQTLSHHEKKVDAVLYELTPEIGNYVNYLDTALKHSYVYYILQNFYKKRFPESRYYRLTEIGPGNALHDDIRKIGNGRYSIWKGAIYFSSSDNSSPLKNGRKYLLLIPLISPDSLAYFLPWMFLFSGYLFLFCIAISSYKFWNKYAIARNIIPGILVTMALAMVAFIVAELVLRSKLPDLDKHKILWPSKHDEVAGFIFEPGATMRWTNHVDFWNEEVANSLGFLDYEPLLPKPEGRFRILLIGDSFVEAAQLGKQYKLQTKLTQLVDNNHFSDFDIVAMGYSGTGQANQYSFYEKYGKLLEPDLVILVFVSNDFANNSPILESIRQAWHPYKSPRLFFSREADGTLTRYSINTDWSQYRLQASSSRERVQELQAILENEDEVKWLDELLENEKWSNLDSPLWADELPQVYKLAFEQTALSFDKWIETARTDKFGLMVVAAENVTFQAEKMSDGFDRFNQINRLREITTPRNLPLLDLEPHFKSKGGFGASTWLYDGHWNENGHQWAAEAIYEYLVDNDFFNNQQF